MREENEEITQEDIEELRKLKREGETKKPVDFKETIRMLIVARDKARSIEDYQVKPKNYPSDLGYFKEGQPMTTSPTLTRYIAQAECSVVKEHIAEVINKAAEMIEKEIEEIRGILG